MTSHLLLRLPLQPASSWDPLLKNMDQTTSKKSGNRDLADRHAEVRDWLEQIYCDDVRPQYEITERTMEILLDLKQKNELREAEARILEKDYLEKTEEYQAEAERLSGILQMVGMSSANLSQSGNVSLRALSESALTLGIKDASTCSYYQALTDVATETLDVEEERMQDRRNISQLSTKTREALMKVQSLKRTLESVQEGAATTPQELEKMMRKAGFFQSKSKEYSKELQRLEAELEKNGVDPSIYHQTLVRLAEDLKDLQTRIAPLKSKLDGYHSLPPRIPLARVKIEEAKRELAGLEEELEKTIDLTRM